MFTAMLFVICQRKTTLLKGSIEPSNLHFMGQSMQLPLLFVGSSTFKLDIRRPKCSHSRCSNLLSQAPRAVNGELDLSGWAWDSLTPATLPSSRSRQSSWVELNRASHRLRIPEWWRRLYNPNLNPQAINKSTSLSNGYIVLVSVTL